jgi:anti-sigma factor RsiW
MKPCDRNRKLIAWLAIHALDARQARRLRVHLETCDGCRRYLAEISQVTEKLANAETSGDALASERFHRQVAQKLQTAKANLFRETLAGYWIRMNFGWRVALPVAATAVLIGAILAAWPRSGRVVPRSVAPQAALTLGAIRNLAPTLANYEQATDQSLDKLDALLTQQSKRSLPDMPRYTVSTHGLAKD